VEAEPHKLTAIVADLAAAIRRLDEFADEEASIAAGAVRDALCHLQFGADLLAKLQPPQAQLPVAFNRTI
jgi:hypothetical protein